MVMTAMLEAAQVMTTDDARDPSAAPRMLIAVDETPAGRRTLASGLVHAAAHGAAVTVLHVVAPQRWRTARFGPVRAVPMRVRDPL
jgi:hypothetical protein